MSYIYKIINDINDKIYVGKTDFSIEKRFKEHCADAFRERNEKRPLYAAMRKYGIEHFHIELIVLMVSLLVTMLLKAEMENDYMTMKLLLLD